MWIICIVAHVGHGDTNLHDVSWTALPQKENRNECND